MQPLLSGEPDRVGDYRLLARLGTGSMGAVYLARSRGGRTVAVKVVRPELAEDPQFRERFRRETRMSAKVGGFWTAAVIDADPDAERPWLATEYVPGPTLHQAVSEHGPLPEHTVHGLAAGLAEALEAIHAAELVHRDLKPGNVLLGPDGPRVIDFGISRAVTASAMTATGMFFGTPGYFSPEQTVGGEVGPPSDVFSLGAVLVFASTGTGPFGNEHTAAMLYRVVHAEPDLDRVPAAIRPLAAACLAKEVPQRPTPTAILERLGGAGPRGNQWLPAPITTSITEHTARWERTVQAAPPDVPQVPDRASSGPEPIGRAPARNTLHQASSRARPVRKDSPGPVFRTGRRAAALVSAAFVLLLAYGATHLGAAIEPTGNAQLVFLLGLTCLILSGGISLLRLLRPPLRLQVNGDGLRISRLGLRQEVPWEHVSRVGIVGRGTNRSVALWMVDGAPSPRSTWWHRIRRYRGGVRVFRIGATGGWYKRHRETRRLRAALQQYARGTYDAGPL
ncbi:serine/threonine protein kinase [Halopolyspora algeriensis]|uniref:Serine/threonine protein kinase n=1 Tax=Halopolyspora algeriensis TaxID=1500506 RepID=A0A368VV33_9ACTN|nr:serine/threonine-protein kinase [Halopolyspora algeriensis]RCW43956.1 serine/threonine protein kinase [Halopolyspora algeriensis]TQM53541.1 serine/threonine protein kinase [Halopolyspora algeriensis]